jgi:hypothetical protein
MATYTQPNGQTITFPDSPPSPPIGTLPLPTLLDYTFTPFVLDIITKNPRCDVRSLGVFPDGITDWRENGKLDDALQYASANQVPLYFPAGYYKCAFDNYYSNLTCIFEEGAIFGGTIHAAINTSPGNPSVNRPSNVKFLGTVGSYERVGSYNCDNVYIERIHLHSDTSKRIGGGKPSGCHFYLDTKNLIIGEIIIDDVESNGSYAVGIDGNSSYEPSNVSIQKITIKDSEVHGLFLCGSGHYIGTVDVYGYGKGSQSIALPMVMLSESQALKAVWCNRLSYSHIDYINITQTPDTLDNAKDAIYCDDGNYSFGTISVLNASARGFAIDAQVETPIVRVDKIKVTMSKTIGIVVNRGSLFCSNVVTQYNTAQGIQTIGGGKVFSSNITADYNGTIGAEFGSATIVIVEYLSASNNSDTTRQVIFTGARNSRIGAINIVGNSETPNTNGGLQIANCNDITINRVDVVWCGVASSANASVRIETSNRITIQSGNIKTGGGQGLRLVTLVDANFNGLTIDDHVTNVTGTALTRVSFSNCVNINASSSLSNIADSSVAQFNSVGMTI